MLQKIIILGTGGTIAGLAADPSQPDRYVAAQLAVSQLVEALPVGQGRFEWQAQQLAQVDSKDMDEPMWRCLLARVLDLIQDPNVHALVVTHGTDTLEETAFLLSAVLPLDKPVILTGAMRPANAPDADGPRNLSDALTAASQLPGGVWVVFAGQIYPASQIQKVHPTALDPFRPVSGRSLALEQLSKWSGSPWPARPDGQWPDAAQVLVSPWPRVELVLSHADAQPWWLPALIDERLNPPLKGLVIAGTGNATWPERWSQALAELKLRGVKIWLCSRCGAGLATPCVYDDLTTVAWTPVQARIGLMLQLITEAPGKPVL